MKKIFLFLLLIPAFLFAQDKAFTVTGNLTGLPENSHIRILSVNQDATVIAQGQSKGSLFALSGQMAEPGLYWLDIAGERIHIYMENSAIVVTGKMGDIKNIRIEGSSSHKDFDQFRNIFNPLVAELNIVVADINKETDPVRKEELMKRYETASMTIKNEVEKFVSAKKDSYVSPFLLYISAQLYDDPVFLDRQYQALSNDIKSSNMGRSLGEFVAYNKVGAIGSDALEFTQNDPSGIPVALSSFRGQYVLIDLWASWCKPCRVENPHVVKAYNKFNNKNFTVLGVSLDQDKDPWLKAIEKDKLTWTQVSDLKGWGNEVAQMYRVSGIPQNFLIDPNGKIVAKNLRGADLEAKLCELLGCN